MGGTSTDVCLVRDLDAADHLRQHGGRVSRSRCRRSTCTRWARAAARWRWLDLDGSLQVGPRSAGAVPGPAAYGLGGTEPTVTDANVVLGRIGAARGGWAAASRSIPARHGGGRDLAGAHGPASAWRRWPRASCAIAVARMTSAIREISIQRGHDPRDFTLIAFGGAGPMHALALADEIGIPRVLVPRHPGNFSALGLLASDIKHDDVRTRVGPLRERGAAARRPVRGDGGAACAASSSWRASTPRQRRLRRSLDLRYRGQAFELNMGARAGEPALSPPSRPPSTASTRRRTATPNPRRRSSWSMRGSAPTAWWPSRRRPVRTRPDLARRRARRAPAGLVRRRCPRLPGVGARAAARADAALDRARHRRGVRRDDRGAAGLARCAVDAHGNMRFERRA